MEKEKIKGNEDREALNNEEVQAEKPEESKEPDVDDVERLKRENEKLSNRIKELEEYAKRLKANFDNYVMQAQKDRERILRSSNEYLITRMLPVLDNFERALAHAESSDFETMLKGLKMIYNQFKRTLEGEGLSEISPDIGDEFDPYYHEAVESVETEEHEEHTIVEVLEKGYKLNGKVLKPAKVKVAIHPKEQRSRPGEGDV